MLQNGDIIDGMYQIVREIGKGGTGVIYLGYHLRLRKQIVIKRIKENYTGRINVRGEADILKRLHHTYLPQVYDFLEAGGGIYTVMDYIPGYDLQYYLDNQYQFPEQTVLLWLKQLCEVLEYLHTQDPPILHSDIKPGNIMITPQGNVCLIDFNISLDGTEGGKLQGLSPHYAAPEQYQAAMDILYSGGGRFVPDPRMDIYSLGAVFYRMMTGYLPEPQTGVPYPIMDLDIPYSEGLKAAISRATEFNPARRFKSARQMGAVLDNLEKLDPEYKRMGRLQVLSAILCGVCVAAGILMIYGGIGVWQKDAWQDHYSELYTASEAGEESSVITAGTDMLNDFMMQGYMNAHPEEKGDVLYIIAESYYRQEQYQTAAEYYQDALKAVPDSSLYLRDYMAALTRSGEVPDIDALQQQYPEAVLDPAEGSFIEAESAFASGDMEEALAKADAAMDLSTDSDLTAAVCDLKADICVGLGRYGDAFGALSTAADISGDRNLLRKAGQTAFNAGNEAASDVEQRTFYEQALTVYERLCGEEDASYEDLLNRALVLRALGKYGTSTDRLREMQKRWPDDYRIPMWMCYNYLDEAALDGDNEMPSEAGFCYDNARDAYESGIQIQEDGDMEELIRIMEERE